jgi:hypothetical protein
MDNAYYKKLQDLNRLVGGAALNLKSMPDQQLQSCMGVHKPNS